MTCKHNEAAPRDRNGYCDPCWRAALARPEDVMRFNGLTDKEVDQMSKTHTHTPGPWKVEDEGTTGDVSDIWIATPGGGHSLARLGDDPQLSHDEHLANARLIAAAPDLLAAAKDVIYDLDLFVSRQGPGPDRRLAALKAAIARAGA